MLKLQERVRFRAIGVPMPQGSKQAFIVGGKARIVDVNHDRLRAWRKIVQEAAEVAWDGKRPLNEPVNVSTTFWLPRPKSIPRKVLVPFKKPDVDKLERAVNDAITYAGVWEDDSRVVASWNEKRYAETDEELPGALVIISTYWEDEGL